MTLLTRFRETRATEGMMTKRSIPLAALLVLLSACGAGTEDVRPPVGSGGKSAFGGSSGNPGGGAGGAKGGQTSASGGASPAADPRGGASTGGGNSQAGGSVTGGSAGAASGSGNGAGGMRPTNGSGGSAQASGGSRSASGGSRSTASGGFATSGGSASSGTSGSGGTGGKSNGTAGAGGASQGGKSGGTGGTTSFRLPTANAPFDYQIGGAYEPPQGVKIVSRDRQSKPATGLYNICYVNGFQVQPGEAQSWEKDHPDLILRDGGGQPVIDENWNEMLLDTSTDAKRAALVRIVGGWIQGCAASGFDAVEIDNLDSYSRSGGLLKEANNIAFMKLLSTAAHGSGLAIAQKNSAELVNQAKQMGTDFAVVEECNRWNECGDYQSGYGNLVFIIEYREQDFKKGCTDHPELSIVLRDLDVTTPGSGSYVYDGC